MTIAPLFSSTCDLAQRIPAMISGFLELENQIGRRFREDSDTDVIIASLLKVGGSDATVLVPPEVKTGGDFDILIVEPSTGEAVQYRIQAKRLLPHASNWDWGSYRELDHPHGTGKQSSTLVRSASKEAIHTIPLYAFYNPEQACAASGGFLSGVEMADGREVNEIVKALRKEKAAGKRPRWKRIEYLRHLFFPLSTVLCPPGGITPPSSPILSPRASRRAVESAIEARTYLRISTAAAKPSLRRPRTDEAQILQAAESADDEKVQPRAPGRKFGMAVRRAIERRLDESPIRVAKVNRPKLVLISRHGQS